jgi:hypothetical protein
MGDTPLCGMLRLLVKKPKHSNKDNTQDFAFVPELKTHAQGQLEHALVDPFAATVGRCGNHTEST